MVLSLSLQIQKPKPDFRNAMSRNPTGAAKQEKTHPPNFAETTECRRSKLFRRISASLGGKFFAPISLFKEYVALQCKIGVLRLSGSFRKESAEFLLDVFTFAFGAARLMFVMLAYSEHFNEFVAAVFATILVGWHGLFLLSLR